MCPEAQVTALSFTFIRFLQTILVQIHSFAMIGSLDTNVSSIGRSNLAYISSLNIGLNTYHFSDLRFHQLTIVSVVRGIATSSGNFPVVAIPSTVFKSC